MENFNDSKALAIEIAKILDKKKAHDVRVLKVEKVLEEMIKIIENYGSVSLADYYDLCGVKCDYTDEHYGFVSNDELKKTKIVRCHNGYTHEFSKVMRI